MLLSLTEDVEVFAISDRGHLFESDWKADSLNPGSEGSIGLFKVIKELMIIETYSVVLSVLGEELDVRMIVVSEDVAIVAKTSSTHDDDVSLMVLHRGLDVGVS